MKTQAGEPRVRALSSRAKRGICTSGVQIPRFARDDTVYAWRDRVRQFAILVAMILPWAFLTAIDYMLRRAR